MATASALGAVTALGYLAVAVTERFDLARGAGNALFALALSASLLAGVVTGPLTQRFGPRPLLATGAALLPGGLLMIAGADGFPVVAAAAVAGVGGGAGCVLVPMLTAVGLGPARGRALALGSFRHPSWRGLRPDRDPHEVRLPPPD